MIVYWVILVLALIVFSPLRPILPLIGLVLLMLSAFFLIPIGLLLGMIFTGFSQELSIFSMLYVFGIYAYLLISDRKGNKKV
jgi:hypothetical protein